MGQATPFTAEGAETAEKGGAAVAATSTSSLCSACSALSAVKDLKLPCLHATDITPDDALERLALLGVDPDTVTIARARTRGEGWRILCSLPEAAASMQRRKPHTYDSGIAPLIRQALARIETMIGRNGT